MPAKFSTPVTALEPGETTSIKIDNFKPENRLFLRQQNSGGVVIQISISTRECIAEIYNAWLEPIKRFDVAKKDGIHTTNLFGVAMKVSISEAEGISNLSLECQNNNSVPFSLSVDSIVNCVHRDARSQVPTVIDLIKGGVCEVELENDGEINLSTSSDIGVITISGEDLVLIGQQEEPVVLREGTTKVGRAHQPAGFFGIEGSCFISRDQLEIEVTKLADKKWKIKISDPGSTNGSQISIPHTGGEAADSSIGDQISKLTAVPLGEVNGRRIFCGEEKQMHPFFNNPDRDPAEPPYLSPYIVASGCDGEINYPQAHIYGCTTTGQRARNEDGFYANPEAHMIAGGDGIAGGHDGGFASSAALAGIAFEGADPSISMEEFPANLSVWLDAIARSQGRIFTEQALPGTTFGFARERNEDGHVLIEGFYVGDYNALIIDFATGRIVYKSKPQTMLDQLALKGPLGAAEKTLVGRIWNGPSNCIYPFPHIINIGPVVFSAIVPSQGRYMTVLYSDGISLYFKPEAIRDFIMTHGKQAGRKITEEALRRGGGDNISYVHMVTEAKNP